MQMVETYEGLNYRIDVMRKETSISRPQMQKHTFKRVRLEESTAVDVEHEEDLPTQPMDCSACGSTRGKEAPGATRSKPYAASG